MDNKELYSLAVGAMNNSYSPYSNCKVGAALLCESGKVYTGTNIENASFSPTVMREFCADDFQIILGESETDFSVATLKELLPVSFSPKDVK